MWHSATAHAQLFILGGLKSSENTLVQELRSKRGDGRLFKMGLFSRGYGTTIVHVGSNKVRLLILCSVWYSSLALWNWPVLMMTSGSTPFSRDFLLRLYLHVHC